MNLERNFEEAAGKESQRKCNSDASRDQTNIDKKRAQLPAGTPMCFKIVENGKSLLEEDFEDKSLRSEGAGK